MEVGPGSQAGGSSREQLRESVDSRGCQDGGQQLYDRQKYGVFFPLKLSLCDVRTIKRAQSEATDYAVGRCTHRLDGPLPSKAPTPLWSRKPALSALFTLLIPNRLEHRISNFSLP